MKWLSALCILFSFSAHAEYRVFKLQIMSADGAETREVLSTLDPDQYPGYHPLKEGETVSYTETWMCRGRTSERPLCPNQKENLTDAFSPEVQEVPDIPPAPAPTTP